MIAVAVLTVLMFSAIYIVVYRTVYAHLDDDLNVESLEVQNSIVMLSDQLVFANPNEWLENEHGQIEVNPTFIQFADTSGQILKKTPNLEDGSLIILPGEAGKLFFNAVLSGSRVRQLQVQLTSFNGNHMGYLSVAIPLEDSQLVLTNLRTVLILLIPLVFIILFFVSRFIAQNSIKPVRVLTGKTEKITRKNLNERIPLPTNRDELYVLTESINNLLERIQDAIVREKQFTSDASHELRTPLSVIKGNLELMTRKERDPSYYLEKSHTSLREVDRMSDLIDRLLLLARYDAGSEKVTMEKIRLSRLIGEMILRFNHRLEEKKLTIELRDVNSITILSNRFMLEQIIENIFTNAIKYSFPESCIIFEIKSQDERTLLTITDEGPGIPTGQQNAVFDRFYRADESRNSETGGTGLGLSIVKRFSELLGIDVTLESEQGKGSRFTLTI